jgi:hypothetical protein
LVEAALACSLCLRRPAIADVHDDEYEGFAVCHCQLCNTATEVGLTPEQVMRLQMAPPERPALRFI